MSKVIGKVAATEKRPTTIDDFHFWTHPDRILKPFDVVVVRHIQDSVTYGVVEEISHITDTAGFLTSFISSDFGDVDHKSFSERISMNYVKARVVGNSDGIYIPVQNGNHVSLASGEEIRKALGLDNVRNRIPCGYITMYEENEAEKVFLPVFFNSKFLIGPEGAHLNISGISGLASKTSYAMFLMKAIQEYYSDMSYDGEESVAFVMLNVKGKDLLAIDEGNDELTEDELKVYEDLELEGSPFSNVKYFYPFNIPNHRGTYAGEELIEKQKTEGKAHFFKYTYEYDKANLDLLFANIDDPSQTMESITNYIATEQGGFANMTEWAAFKSKVTENCKAGSKTDKEITVASWRKFKRIINKALNNRIFSDRVCEEDGEVRLQDAIRRIQKNEVCVIDIAKLDEGMQGFVFGDVMRAVYDLKLGILDGRSDQDIPKRIVIFIDELNKYASSDVPKNSPILRQIIDIAERGRSLGIVLFGAEQFRSAIHSRVTGNCATNAYGRTNSIEVSKTDYRFIPGVYKGMMTRLKQGELILQNPLFRSLLNIKFPKPIYRQFKG